ncbi:MAG: histidine kinase dimerization/phospho-acceptor domain-containing protein [Thermodesulfobacteriota bacterium]
MKLPKNVDEAITRARKACHDINQPLTVIMARSELVLLKMGPEDPNRKAMEQIHQQAEKMAGLVEDLRTILRGLQGE